MCIPHSQRNNFTSRGPQISIHIVGEPFYVIRLVREPTCIVRLVSGPTNEIQLVGGPIHVEHIDKRPT